MNDDTKKYNMNNDILFSEKVYTTKEVSGMVGIAEVTVRKYAQILEEVGYKFLKSNTGIRDFVEKDIIILLELKDLSIQTKKPVKKLAELIVSRDKQTVSGVNMDNLDDSKNKGLSRYSRQEVSQIVQTSHQMVELNKELFKRLDQKDKQFEENLRKRDEQLMTVLREVQETKKLLVATMEENKKKKSFFERLFKK